VNNFLAANPECVQVLIAPSPEARGSGTDMAGMSLIIFFAASLHDMIDDWFELCWWKKYVWCAL